MQIFRFDENSRNLRMNYGLNWGGGGGMRLQCSASTCSDAWGVYDFMPRERCNLRDQNKSAQWLNTVNVLPSHTLKDIFIIHLFVYLLIALFCVGVKFWFPLFVSFKQDLVHTVWKLSTGFRHLFTRNELILKVYGLWQTSINKENVWNKLQYYRFLFSFCMQNETFMVKDNILILKMTLWNEKPSCKDYCNMIWYTWAGSIQFFQDHTWL